MDPERRGRTDLGNGRALGWSEWGPHAGTPVLFCPGAGTSSRLGFGEGLVTSLGVRLIGLDRPGLGASDPAPGRSLLDWADDVAALLAARGIERPRMVGFSQGAPFALSCAARRVVGPTAIVSGGDEIASPHFAGTLVPDVARLVELAARDPEGAEALFGQMSAGTMHGMVTAMSGPRDRALYAERSFDEAFRSALAEGFAQGSGGYARDTLLAMLPWPFALSEIEARVELWYGAEDASPVHSPDLGASLVRRIPGARRHVVESAGGAVLWTHAAEILGSLLGA